MGHVKKINNKGFSLVELLVCLAISAIVIIAAYSLVMVGMKQYENNTKITNLQSESKYTMNILRENIIAGDQKNMKMYYGSGYPSSNNYILYLNTNEGHNGKVLYYDKSKNSLYIYEDVVSNPSADAYGTEPNDHLVSKYVSDFQIEFADNIGGLTVPTPLDLGSGNYVQVAYTNLVKVRITFDVKGKTDTTEIVYQVRNKS